MRLLTLKAVFAFFRQENYWWDFYAVLRGNVYFGSVSRIKNGYAMGVIVGSAHISGRTRFNYLHHM